MAGEGENFSALSKLLQGPLTGGLEGTKLHTSKGAAVRSDGGALCVTAVKLDPHAKARVPQRGAEYAPVYF